jgi:hypothetical protein
MREFLTFDRFVTPDALILFYYLGAVAMPFFLWRTRSFLIRKLPFCATMDVTARSFFSALKPAHRAALVLFFVSLFLGMELMWRMIFETMIGYFQMHDALRQLVDLTKK